MGSNKAPLFNKDQREGFAKFLDGIAQAYVIGVTIGSVGIVEHKISPWVAVMLFALAILLVYTSFKIRSSPE